MISIFLNLLRPNFWPEVWFILEKVFHVHLRMCMLLLLGRVFPIHLLHLVDSVASSISLLLSGCFIHYCEWNIDVPNHYCRALYFFLQFCQFLLHIFWWSVIRCAHVYNCYIFLLQCTFCWYTMPFSFYSSGNVLISSSFWRTVFSDIGILTDWVFFLLEFWMSWPTAFWPPKFLMINLPIILLRIPYATIYFSCCSQGKGEERAIIGEIQKQWPPVLWSAPLWLEAAIR